MIFAFRNICWKTSNLDTSLTRALSRYVDGDSEVLFKLLANVATRADQVAVLIDWNINDFGGLTFFLADESLNCSNNPFDNSLGTLESKCVRLVTRLRELYCLCPKISAASIGDNTLDVGTCRMLASNAHGNGCLLTSSANQGPMVLSVYIHGSSDNVIKCL